jgi:hypothetical protein
LEDISGVISSEGGIIFSSKQMVLRMDGENRLDYLLPEDLELEDPRSNDGLSSRSELLLRDTGGAGQELVVLQA